MITITRAGQQKWKGLDMDPLLDGIVSPEPEPGREGFFVVHGDGFCGEFHKELHHLGLHGFGGGGIVGGVVVSGLTLVTCHTLFNESVGFILETRNEVVELALDNCNLVVLLSNEHVEAKVFEEDKNEGEVGVVGDGGLMEHGLERVNMLAALGGLLEKDVVA